MPLFMSSLRCTTHACQAGRQAGRCACGPTHAHRPAPKQPKARPVPGKGALCEGGAETATAQLIYATCKCLSCPELHLYHHHTQQLQGIASLPGTLCHTEPAKGQKHNTRGYRPAMALRCRLSDATSRAHHMCLHTIKRRLAPSGSTDTQGAQRSRGGGGEGERAVPSSLPPLLHATQRTLEVIRDGVEVEALCDLQAQLRGGLPQLGVAHKQVLAEGGGWVGRGRDGDGAHMASRVGGCGEGGGEGGGRA